MPEIIEAEITKQKLALAIKGKRILDLWTDWPKGLVSQKRNPKRTARDIKNRQIKSVERVGKSVVVHLEKDKVLAIHQRMSGSIIYKPSMMGSSKKHIHFKITLDDGSEFALLDPRKFGVVWYGSRAWFLKQPYIQKLGHDAMKVDEQDFAFLFDRNSSSVKSLLLQQDKLAGLGNIACDEILWKAKVHPKRKASTIEQKEIHSLYRSMYEVLASVLKHGGTSMSDWSHPDGEKGRYQRYFKVYKRSACRRCKEGITREVVAGRGTYFCAACQS